MDLVQLIESLFSPMLGAINGVLWNYVLVLLLVGIWFSIRLGFVQVRRFPKMVSGLVRGTAGDDAGISPLQSLCTSFVSRVGTGNLVGVALAMGIGGSGAIFWMWLAAIFSVCLILAFGLVFSAVQANSISEVVTAAFGIHPGWTAIAA